MCNFARQGDDDNNFQTGEPNNNLIDIIEVNEENWEPLPAARLRQQQKVNSML